jgi:hypothetical protein
MMNWKTRKEAVIAYFKVLSCLFLEGLKKIMKKFSQDSHRDGQDLNQAPPEYKSEALSFQLTFSAKIFHHRQFVKLQSILKRDQAEILVYGLTGMMVSQQQENLKILSVINISLSGLSSYQHKRSSLSPIDTHFNLLKYMKQRIWINIHTHIH